MNVVSMSGAQLDPARIVAAREAAHADVAAASARRAKERLQNRNRKRVTRFLTAGGVLIREDCRGAVGVRWSRASRSGGSFDTAICERRLRCGRLEPVENWPSAFRAVPRDRWPT